MLLLWAENFFQSMTHLFFELWCVVKNCTKFLSCYTTAQTLSCTILADWKLKNKQMVFFLILFFKILSQFFNPDQVMIQVDRLKYQSV